MELTPLKKSWLKRADKRQQAMDLYKEATSGKLLSSEEQQYVLFFHFQLGNHKLPASTAIFNSGTATDCPSRKLGLCQAGEHCYALKAEKLYKQSLPYRQRQAELWRMVTPHNAAMAIAATGADTFRYNEAGDFSSQMHVDWFSAVCRCLQELCIAAYGYTARTDLDLSRLADASALNVSNDVHTRPKTANRFVMVDKASGIFPVCPGSCKRCRLCLTAKGRRIEIVRH